MVNNIRRTLIALSRSEDPAIRLICFPYAGGNAHMFRSWAQSISECVALYAIQLPGRAERVSENPISELSSAVAAISDELLPLVDRPIILFGHSVGAILAFEIAYLLQAESPVYPSHLFVAGRQAPHLPSEARAFYQLPKADFIEEVFRMGGLPPEVKAHSELMEILLPALRADIAISQTYEYHKRELLNCPITALGGVSDPECSLNGLNQWKFHTSNHCSVCMIPGDHFFVHAAQLPICALLNATIRGITDRVRQTDHLGNLPKAPENLDIGLPSRECTEK